MSAEPPPVYVGFWMRVLASLIDTVLLGAISIPLLLAVVGDADTVKPPSSAQAMVQFTVTFILPAVATIAFWTGRHATPGKMVIGARVVDAVSGGAPSMGQHLIRYLGYFVSAAPLFLGFAWIAFDRRKQGWHDKLAGTVVVRTRRR
jgi:uncharacterized RDD family membrane protein YckC